MTLSLKNVFWTILMAVLAYVVLLSAGYLLKSSMMDVYCSQDRLGEELRTAQGQLNRTTRGSPKRKEARKLADSIGTEVLACIGWSSHLVNGIVFFLVGMGVAHGIQSGFWYLYVLAVPGILAFKRFTMALWDGSETPMGHFIYATEPYQSLILTLFITSLLGGYLYEVIYGSEITSDNDSEEELTPERIDQKWWIYFDDEVLERTYSRRELVNLALFDEDLLVCRAGDEDWVKVKEDPLLNDFLPEDDGVKWRFKFSPALKILVALLFLHGSVLAISSNELEFPHRESHLAVTKDKASDSSENQSGKASGFDECDPPEKIRKEARKWLNKMNYDMEFMTVTSLFDKESIPRKILNKYVRAGLFTVKQNWKLHNKVYKNVTVLHLVSSVEYHPFLERALKCIDPNVAGGKGVRPLHFAAFYNHDEVVKKLIESGADVNVSTKRELTPVDMTLLTNSPESLEILVDNGADLEFEYSLSPFRKTPLEKAKRSRRDAVLSILRKNGVNIEKELQEDNKDKSDTSPLDQL